MVHGVAKLAISGRLPWSEPAVVLDFTDVATTVLSRGMARAITPQVDS
jgi:hypothetical protein